MAEQRVRNSLEGMPRLDAAFLARYPLRESPYQKRISMLVLSCRGNWPGEGIFPSSSERPVPDDACSSSKSLSE